MQEALEGFASLEIPPLNGEKEGEREREGGGRKQPQAFPSVLDSAPLASSTSPPFIVHRVRCKYTRTGFHKRSTLSRAKSRTSRVRGRA